MIAFKILDTVEINKVKKVKYNLMTKQLEEKYLLDHSEKNILIHPRNPVPPLEFKW